MEANVQDLLSKIESRLSISAEKINRIRGYMIEFLDLICRSNFLSDKNGRYLENVQLSHQYIEFICGGVARLGRLEISEMDLVIKNNSEGFSIKIGNLLIKSPWESYRVYVSMDR